MRTPDDIHDEWLVLKCQAGDSDALAELVDRWQPRLLRYVMQFTGLPEAAGDVVQAVWVAILRGLGQLDDPACFRRWAYQIATHKCADWVRERQRNRADFVQLATEPIDEKTKVENKEDQNGMVRAALRQLPPYHRTVLSMFYLDDMPLAAIADALALPIGTIKSRLYYARFRLKEILERNKT